jgi:hypothetical protein
MSAEPTELWPWLALVGLGFFHGINPTMGWLFAVALGLHRRSFRTVLLSLVPSPDLRQQFAVRRHRAGPAQWVDRRPWCRGEGRRPVSDRGRAICVVRPQPADPR